MPKRGTGTSAASLEIEIVEGDITTVSADAIVNAANTELILGAGVAGAIRTRGGPAIQDECNRLAPIALGEAVVTGAGTLPATRHVIHAAAMKPGEPASPRSIRMATISALERAEEIGARTVAIPALGMGIGAVRLDEGVREMLDAVAAHQPRRLQKVIFALFPEPAAVFRALLPPQKSKNGVLADPLEERSRSDSK